MITIISTASAFPLGQIVATPNALKTLTSQEIAEGLQRHANCDWGNVCNEDFDLNTASLHTGDRLLSAYGEGGKRFWIITEADRSMTTILMPEDY